MANTTGNGAIPLPVQTTSPPDVVKWLTDGFQDVDTWLTTANAPIGHIRYGPVGSVPSSLPPGVIFCGW